MAVIRLIVECLASENDLTKAVACFDLGEFAKFHPHGKDLLNSMPLVSLIFEHYNILSPKLFLRNFVKALKLSKVLCRFQIECLPGYHAAFLLSGTCGLRRGGIFGKPSDSLQLFK